MDKRSLLIIFPVLIILLIIAIAVLIFTDQNTVIPENNAPSIICVQGGCSGQLCVEKGNDAVTTCEWNDAYQCFNDALCEIQADGKCGWTLTEEYEACMDFIDQRK